METFVIMPLTHAYTTGTICDNLTLQYLHPSSKIRARRISPLFIYSEELGYMKTFNEIQRRPHLLEEDVKIGFEFGIEICEKSGCHVTLYPDTRAIYAYTLPYKTRSVIIGKKGDYYQLYTGGWTTKFVQQYLPVRQKKRLFRFLPMKQSFFVIITHPEGASCTNESGSKWMPMGTLMKVQRKGFVQDKMVFFSESGWVAQDKVQPIGKDIVEPSSLPPPTVHMCLICTQKTVNCSFVHGDFAHSFCCYECSKKIATTSSTCPICRLPVEKIIMNYTQEFPLIQEGVETLSKKTEAGSLPLQS